MLSRKYRKKIEKEKKKITEQYTKLPIFLGKVCSGQRSKAFELATTTVQLQEEEINS